MGALYTSRTKPLFAFFLLICMLTGSGQTPETQGQWSVPIGFDIVPVAVANLPDGRLLTWAASSPTTFVEISSGATYTEIFDPTLGTDGQALGQFVSNTRHDMFCPGINNLPDGRIMAAGGATSDKTSIFDPVTERWTEAATMNIPRGYQGNVTLSDGSVFTLGGSWADGNYPSTNGQKDAEIWSPLTGWFKLPGILGADIFTANDLNTEARGLYRIDNHLWLWPAPNGKIFHAGPSEEMHWIDVTGTGSISSAGLRGTDTYSMKGTTVMFDVGKILKVGGAESYDSDHPAKDNAFVIDINTENAVSVTPTANHLEFSRTMLNTVVLPNGEVLVTGGLDRAVVFSDVGARFAAEIYNPHTNSWRTVAGMSEARTYHSVSILMNDGRVFVGGGGLCDSTPDCVNHQSAEIYSPPYLFTDGGALAARPSISAPDEADYNSTITVTGSPGITEFSLIRFSSATHSTNNEQRRIPVAFTGGGGNYNVSVPDRNLLPPGYYMLFALDGDGVPSVAETIMVGDALPLATNPNLVLHLEFEDAEGSSTLLDSSGNGNDGFLYDVDDNGATKVPSTDNIPATDNGLFGKAAEFDGAEFQSNTILEVPYDATFDATSSSVTVMAWVNRDELVHNVGILSHDYPALFFGFHNSLYKWEFPTTEGSVNCYAGYSPLGSWVHIAATYDGTTARLFANGIEVCTQTATGGFVINDAPGDASAFTSSGFYEQRDPAGPFLTGAGYNQSGVTDEIDGRIDELKVYNKALGAEEIKAFFDLGSGLAGVPDCPQGTITAEFKIDDGEWTAGNNVNAPEGSRVYLRAVTAGTYYVTTAQRDFEAPTLRSAADFDQADGYQVDTGVSDPQNDSPERNDGLVDLENQGSFVLTTAAGCATVVNVNVVKQCDPEDILISPEWRIGSNPYQHGDPGENVTISVALDERVRLSILPNVFENLDKLSFSITTPRGATIPNITGDYTIGRVTPADIGVYVLTSIEGCTVLITLDLLREPVCPEGNIVGEYRINGSWQSGSGTLEVTEGDVLMLSMLPNDIPVESIALPDGRLVRDNHNLGAVDVADQGRYLITSVEGCTTAIDLVVGADCPADSLVHTHEVGGIPGTGGLVLADEGVSVTLGLGAAVGTVLELPDGTSVGVPYIIGIAGVSDAGTYTLVNTEGCSTEIELRVNSLSACPEGNIVGEYRINGSWQSGSGTLEVTEGDVLMLSMLPNDIPVESIALPDGRLVRDNHNLGAVDVSDQGRYLITSVEGCTTAIDLVVGADCPADSLVHTHEVGGIPGTGGLVLADEGVSVTLGLGAAVGTVLELPDGTSVGVPYIIGIAGVSDAGTYTLVNTEGCSTEIELRVNSLSACPEGNIVGEYRINGSWQSGSGTLEVTEGDVLMLSMLPNDIPVESIALPDGRLVRDNHNLGAVDVSDQGRYLITSVEGCTTAIDLVVGADCPADSLAHTHEVGGIPGTGGLILADEGVSVTLGLGAAVGTVLELPDGTSVGVPYIIGVAGVSDAGTYTLVNTEGCSTEIELRVNSLSACPEGNIVGEYRINGSWQSGSGTLEVTEGDVLMLSMLPNDIPVESIALPDGRLVRDNHNLGAVDISDQGRYLITSVEGCTTAIDLIVAPTAETPIALKSRLDSVDDDRNELRVFPNPSKGTISIDLSGPAGTAVGLTVYNMLQQKVVSHTFPATHLEFETLDLTGLPDGFYALVFDADGHTEVQTIVMKK